MIVWKESRISGVELSLDGGGAPGAGVEPEPFWLAIGDEHAGGS
jgi:hypothetical protein